MKKVIMSLLALGMTLVPAHSAILWLMPAPPICNAQSITSEVHEQGSECLAGVIGAAGGNYNLFLTGTGSGCFLFGRNSILELTSEQPYTWSSLWAQCYAYNPVLQAEVVVLNEHFDYIDDFGDLNLADGLDNVAQITGSPWFLPGSSVIRLYRMETEADCFEPTVRDVSIPGPQPC
jgi:hypothetical protein